MNKKGDVVMKRMICLLIMIIVFGSLFLVEKSYGFCVYNHTDRKMAVIQKRGGRPLKSFRAYIEPGKHACCNWKNKDCNTGGKRDSIVEFEVFYESNFVDKSVCFNFPIKAGGWLEIVGKNKSYRCIRHDY